MDTQQFWKLIEEARSQVPAPDNGDAGFVHDSWFWLNFRALSLIEGFLLVDHGDRRMRRRRRSKLARPYI
ncbi:hypothetical protein, partial [Kitasatospora sp. NPDC059327]|uniref:hypothetical protein n=1 Tax=Kitasatospora sp. NPDC059327 TaxID=3346803 RepID=UPI0036C2624B